jgi:methionine--tRNA ligase beta chain
MNTSNKNDTSPQLETFNQPLPSGDNNAASSDDQLIDIQTFMKLDLRVAEVLEAEQLHKSKKLLKLKVSLGETLGIRQIVSGIALFYTPESLIGKKIIVVANLKPAALMGVESQGMLLAGSLDTPHPDDPSRPPVTSLLKIIEPDQKLPLGTRIR